MLLLGPDVHGSTLGIVGFGRIGQAVARRAAGFGMTILYHDVQRADPAVEAEHSATFLPLEKLLAQADFVSLHVNLTPETRGLINAEKLGWMKPTAVLVNTSRGPVVDPRALADALRDGDDLRRRPRRHRSRADPDRRPAPVARQLPRRAAHRLGVAGHARQDGRDGGGEPARRPARRATSDAGEPGGLRGRRPDAADGTSATPRARLGFQSRCRVHEWVVAGADACNNPGSSQESPAMALQARRSRSAPQLETVAESDNR